MSIKKASPVIRVATGVALSLSSIWPADAAAVDLHKNTSSAFGEVELLPIVVCNPQGYDLVSQEAATDIHMRLVEIASIMPLDTFSGYLDLLRQRRDGFNQDYNMMFSYEAPKVDSFISILSELPATSDEFVTLPEQKQIESLFRVLDGLVAMEQVFGAERLKSTGLNNAIKYTEQTLWDYAEHLAYFISQDDPVGCPEGETLPNTVDEPANENEAAPKQNRLPSANQPMVSTSETLTLKT